MIWPAPAAQLLGGAAPVNAVPHLVAGVQGQAFQTPLADPPGRGRSTSTANVLRASANLLVACLLLRHVGRRDLHLWSAALPPALGGLALALFSAHHFGRVNGGDRPSGPDAPTAEA